MKELTKAEEKVMRILWDREKSIIRDLLNDFEEPKPSYTTVATVVRVLEKKGFVSHKAYGTTYEYYPIISQESYSDYLANSVLNKYFGGSLKQLVSFFAKRKDVNMTELDEIVKEIEKHKSEK